MMEYTDIRIPPGGIFNEHVTKMQTIHICNRHDFMLSINWTFL